MPAVTRRPVTLWAGVAIIARSTGSSRASAASSSSHRSAASLSVSLPGASRPAATFARSPALNASRDKHRRHTTGGSACLRAGTKPPAIRTLRSTRGERPEARCGAPGAAWPDLPPLPAQANVEGLHVGHRISNAAVASALAGEVGIDR